MPITQDDVRLFASVRMTDFVDGGGRMSTVEIVDGQDNNVFPDITELERLTGKVSLRKLHAAAINADNDAYLSAHVVLADTPDDPACTSVILLSSGYTSERPSAVNSLLVNDAVLAPSFASGGYEAELGTPYLWSQSPPAVTPVPQPDPLKAWVIVGTGSPSLGVTRFPLAAAALNDPAQGGALRTRYTMNANFPAGSGRAFVTYSVVDGLDGSATSNRTYGTVPVLAAPASGGTTIDVVSILVRVLPLAEAAPAPTVTPIGGEPWATWNLLPTANISFAQSVAALNGERQVLHTGGAILIHDTARLAPATVSNGQTVNTGRTTLGRLRVIGNNGVEIARFVRNATPPSAVGCTANLDAGTVTFSNVSGMAQPVTIEHSIEEMSTVVSYAPIAGGYRLTLPAGRPLSRAYPSTARVSSILSLGDLQGRAQAGFPQSAWTGVFSDTVIGGTPSADYDDVNYPVLCTNEGAITERWAIEFTSSTAYRLWGERLGLIGVGNTATDFAPINPATSAPYFTLRALGWGLGWSAGNAYRFNTSGANASIWVARSVRPSTPFGDDSVTPELRGFVNV